MGKVGEREVSSGFTPSPGGICHAKDAEDIFQVQEETSKQSLSLWRESPIEIFQSSNRERAYSWNCRSHPDFRRKNELPRSSSFSYH